MHSLECPLKFTKVFSGSFSRTIHTTT